MKVHVREYREAANLTQTELGNMVGVSRQTISSIENGSWSPTTYLAGMLMKALNASFEDLFEFVEKEV